MGQVNLFTNKEEPEKVYKTQSSWSKLVRSRDGWKCSNTDKYPNRDHTLFILDAHHMWPKKHGGQNILSNGITFCRACHAAEHPEYQQKFEHVFKLQAIRIKDFIFGLFGVEKELQYYQLLYFLTEQLNFRPYQKEIIKTIVEDKKHVFVVMPTGTGKSLLYQVPGLLNQELPSLIISPLKALQVDQVSQLGKRWIPSTYINSSLGKSEFVERIRLIRDNLFRFVFAHPKQLLAFDKIKNKFVVKFYNPLASSKFNMLVVDEVHVIKNQGISFVKEYYHIDEIYKLYSQPQMILLTATASKNTREFIIDKLKLDRDSVAEFVGGFRRPEIRLEVLDTNYYDNNTKKYILKDDTLIDLLNIKSDGKTIVFVTTRKEVDAVYDLITQNGFKASKYRGDMSDNDKELNSKLFTGGISNSEVNIIVATSAYGMGIDIPNIHKVIHYSLPFTLTDYYQQFGRAGRDGKPSVAYLLHDVSKSTGTIDFINNITLENEKDIELRKQMFELYQEEHVSLMEYIVASDKWEYILEYFGEDAPTNPKFKNFIYIMAIVIIALLCAYFYLNMVLSTI